MIKPRFKVRLTSFGKTAMFLAIFLLFAAQNTGNNLLFLMSSCFISAVALSGFLAFRNLSGIKIEVEIQDVICAGDKAFLKCFVLESANREHFSVAFENDFIGVIPPADKVMLKTSFQAPSRGTHILTKFSLFSFFPFGLSAVSLCLPDQEVFVGPRCAQELPELIDREVGGAIQKYQSGKEGEYWMQKHYQPGEDASLINWTISARSDAEWVLMKAQNYGLPEKLYFDFSSLDKGLFEDCLEMVMGAIFRFRSAGSSAFIWAEQKDGKYCWLSISENYPLLVKWLAKLQFDDRIPPPSGDYKGIEFAELLRNV